MWSSRRSRHLQQVWLGYAGLAAALASGKISLTGAARSISVARRLLALPDQPTLKNFRFLLFHFQAPWPPDGCARRNVRFGCAP